MSVGAIIYYLNLKNKNLSSLINVKMIQDSLSKVQLSIAKNDSLIIVKNDSLLKTIIDTISNAKKPVKRPPKSKPGRDIPQPVSLDTSWTVDWLCVH